MRNGSSKYARLDLRPFVACISFALAVPAAAQSERSPPYQQSPPTAQRSPGLANRGFELERDFFMAAESSWKFFHSLDSLPTDMMNVLHRTAGPNVVGPGEPINETDIVDHPGRVQHLYTAVTDNLGVIVWYDTGPFTVTRAVLYDRELGDACRYNFGKQTSPVVPLSSVLRHWIQTRGFQVRGCEYLSSDTFK